jgi:hypothetical protein
MKRALFAAATAGLGALGAAGLMAAAPAQADSPCDATPPLTPTRVACVTNEQIGQFTTSIDPARNIGILINGELVDNGDGTSSPSGLGLRDQPTTFVNSVVGPGGFLDGPRSPDGPSEPAP